MLYFRMQKKEDSMISLVMQLLMVQAELVDLIFPEWTWETFSGIFLETFLAEADLMPEEMARPKEPIYV